MTAVMLIARSAQVAGSGTTVRPRSPVLSVNVQVLFPLVRPQTPDPLLTSVPV
jgi:hypothetical protein